MEEQFIVSARKYRPQDFYSVVGQSSLTATLKNAIKTKHLAHAYLFCGPRGVGKTTCARIFAKTINCQNLTESGEACNECESCKSFNDQRSMNIFELDAASNNSVDDIRELVKSVYIPPQIGKYSVYIIDEVHMLSSAAFNAFLKTLEEPPEYAIFILATTEKHKIIPTIISRCQIYDFKRIEVSDTIEYLKYVAGKENITTEDEALSVIAQKADGAMRDALSIFDQVVSFCGKNVTYQAVIDNLNVLDFVYYFRLVDMFFAGDVVNSLLVFNEILNKGFDAQNFVSGLSSHFRDILVSRDQSTLPLLQKSENIAKQYYEQAVKCPLPFLYKALDIANTCDLNYRTSRNKRLLVELMLIKLCQIVESSKTQDTSSKTQDTSNKTQDVSNKTQDTSNKAQDTSDEQQPATVNAVEVAETPKLPNLAQVMQNSGFHNALTPKIDEAKPVENEQINEPQTENQTENINHNFNEIQLVEAWQNFGNSFDDDFQKNLIISISPKKEENLCIILALSTSQKDFLTEKKSAIERFLQNELKNSEIKLKIEINEDIKPVVHYSPEDILKQMTQQNPILNNFVAELNLQVKY
ncbi:MAG: DNA polymerase III subunit gamma/tau [Prevotellaceae bacterium]|jgi:DNA polymerase-3 subunit gamma/tau|nr:DNA polymerase III subunit gamma/tau [Prevotellaceae bacterium]